MASPNAGPITGSELIPAVQGNQRIFLTRPQVAALLALQTKASDRPYDTPTNFLGTERFYAVQGGQAITFNGADLVAFLAASGVPDPVAPALQPTTLTGTERLLGAQSLSRVAFSIAEAITVRDGAALPLPSFTSYAARRLDIDGSSPIIDLDYENSRFYVGSVVYTSVDAAVAAGAVIKSASSPIGDDWALPAYGGTLSLRGKGIASRTAPTSSVSQFLAGLDDNTTNNTNIVALSRSYRAANDYPAATTTLRSGTTGNVTATATPSVANGSPFLAAVSVGVGTAGNRLATPKVASATSNINGVPETLTRLVVGNNRAGTRAWGGTIQRVTVYAGVLAVEKLQAAGAADLDSGRVPLWPTGYVNPTSVCIGDVTYLSGYMPGNPFAMGVSNKDDATYGALVAYRTLGTTPTGIDDHNRPSIRLNKAGTGFSFAYNDHTADNLFRYRSTTTPDLKNYAATGGSVDTSTLGPPNSYSQQFVHDPTGDIYAICRQGALKYTYMRSTDNGATFTLANTRVAFNHTDQFYYQARWIDADTLLMYFSENPSAAQGQIRVLTWNVVTGDVRSGSGLLGNVLSGAVDAGVPIGGATILRSEATADWSAGVFFPTQFGIAMIWGRATNPSGTALFGESYHARHTGGSYFDPNNYVVTKIADVGLGAGSQQRFTGGNAPSQLSTLTKPRVFIAQHIGNTWQINQWDAADANGTSWSKTATLRTVSDAGYNVAFRPISPENCSPRMEVFWAEGYYEDYFGAGKLDLYQCWKRD